DAVQNEALNAHSEHGGLLYFKYRQRLHPPRFRPSRTALFLSTLHHCRVPRMKMIITMIHPKPPKHSPIEARTITILHSFRANIVKLLEFASAATLLLLLLRQLLALVLPALTGTLVHDVPVRAAQQGCC